MEHTFTHTTTSIAELLNQWQITNYSLIGNKDATVTLSSESLNQAATRVLDGESVSDRLYIEDSLIIELLDAEQDIQSLMSGLYSGDPLSRSAELEALAEEAIQHTQMHQDSDIEQWASQLADWVVPTTTP